MAEPTASEIRKAKADIEKLLGVAQELSPASTAHACRLLLFAAAALCFDRGIFLDEAAAAFDTAQSLWRGGR